MKAIGVRTLIILLSLFIISGNCERGPKEGRIPDIDGLERRPSPRFAIMSVDPHIAMPGQALEILGGEILAPNSEIRVVFTDKRGREVMAVPDRSDDFEINLTVPDDVPRGISYITLLQPDQGGMVESINKAWFLVPEEGEIGGTGRIFDIGDAEVVYSGFLGSGQNSRRFKLTLDKNQTVDLKAEAFKIEDYEIIIRNDGRPDLQLSIDTGGGGLHSEDDIGPDNFNCVLNDLKLKAGQYYINVYVPRNYAEKHDVRGIGWIDDVTSGFFRLTVKRKGGFSGQSTFE